METIQFIKITILAILILALGACDAARFTDKSADCEQADEIGTLADGTVRYWYAATIPVSGSPKLYAEVCFTDTCDETGHYPVTIADGKATVICGAGSSKPTDTPPAYAIFKEGK
jgi:hypothetical protein